MFSGIQGIKREGFNLWWSDSVERKNIIVTSKTNPGASIHRTKSMIVKTNTGYMVVIRACIEPKEFSARELLSANIRWYPGRG